MSDIENYEDTDEFRFAQELLNDTPKEALVAMYYTALYSMSEADEMDVFDVHNEIIDVLNKNNEQTQELH